MRYSSDCSEQFLSIPVSLSGEGDLLEACTGFRHACRVLAPSRLKLVQLDLDIQVPSKSWGCADEGPGCLHAANIAFPGQKSGCYSTTGSLERRFVQMAISFNQPKTSTLSLKVPCSQLPS